MKRTERKLDYYASRSTPLEAETPPLKEFEKVFTGRNSADAPFTAPPPAQQSNFR